MANLAEDLFGALYIQAFIASILYGITTLQAFFYSQTYRKDPVFLKCYVAIVWILETVHTAFCIQFAYAYLVRNFGDFEYFMTINWGIGGMLICGTLTALMVQAFYVRRVYILSNCNMYLTAFITFFMLSIFGFAVMFVTLTWMYPTWMGLKMHIPPGTTALSLISAVTVDVSIVVTLMWILIRKRHGIPENTKTAVDWILLYLVNTGALTAACRIISVILYTTQKDNLAFLGVQEIQGKLYANSFLGSLNTRSFIRRKVEEHPSLETTRDGAAGAPMEIFHQTEVITDAWNDESSQNRSTRSIKGSDTVV
ncbi:hypothetical protein LXA43DRAFT_1055489 [Ganoderma leucocontextum]|nr:hypothetical protein LXA43DRAFT_1055489 [Ganoderma leucocontextum]